MGFSQRLFCSSEQNWLLTSLVDQVLHTLAVFLEELPVPQKSSKALVKSAVVKPAVEPAMVVEESVGVAVAVEAGIVPAVVVEPVVDKQGRQLVEG